MSDELSSAMTWLLRTVLGGGALLLVVWGLARWVPQPARRQRLVESGIAAALMVAVLAVLPAWVPIPLPIPREPPASTSTSSFTVEPEPTATTSGPAQEFSGAAIGAVEDVCAEAYFTPLPKDTYLAGFGGPRSLTVPTEEQNETPVVSAITNEVALPEPLWSISWNNVFPFVLGAYLTGAALFTGRWLLGLLGVWRLLRSAFVPPSRVERQFAHMTRHMRNKPRVLASRKLRVPVSCGFWRPTVVLPASLCRREERSRLPWVFAHELTHLKRGDAWSGVLIALGSALYYFCPWFWVLRRQVRLCQEYVADAAAVSHDARHEDYAQFLLGLASAPAGPALAMSVRGTASDLFRRVTMLLQDPIRVERRCSRLWCVGTALSLLAVAVFVAGIGATPNAKAASPDKPFVADDEKDPAKDDAKPAKNKKKEELKKKIDRRMAELENFPFEDLRKALENLPDQVDTERIEAEVRKALEQLKEQNKELGLHGEELKKHATDALKKIDKDALKLYTLEALNAIDNDEVKKKVKEALDKANFKGDFNFDGDFNAFRANPDDRHRVLTTAGGQGRLGIMIDQPSAALREHLDLPEDRGLVITQVHADSAAAKAGIKVNDILMEFNGKSVSSNGQDLQKMVEGLEAKSKVDAVVLRKGKKERITGILIADNPGPGGRRNLQGLGGGRGGAGAGAFPGQPGFGPGGGGAFPGGPGGAVGGMAVFGGGPGTVMTSISRSNERVNARHQEGNLVISLTGNVMDGQAKISDIHIQDGGKAEKYDSIEDVPERYRDKVKNLVEMSEKCSIKIDVKSPRRERPSRNRDDSDPDNKP